jgi:hypothetical protein
VNAERDAQHVEPRPEVRRATRNGHAHAHRSGPRAVTAGRAAPP